jgi:hypothetical protein
LSIALAHMLIALALSNRPFRMSDQALFISLFCDDHARPTALAMRLM